MTRTTVPTGLERFAAVSRETTDRLNIYARLVAKWNGAINILGKSTEDEIWSRHFLESAAVFHAARCNQGRWLDLGSGGGFPGAVVAILAADVAPGLSVTCIEADIRKCAFLRTLSRETGVGFGVLSRRIEDVPPQKADMISARALAPLHRLLEHCDRHLAPGGRAVFPKGENWESEVSKALETWKFSVEKIPSPTKPGAVILTVGDIVRA